MQGTLLCGVKWESCVFDSSGENDRQIGTPQRRYYVLCLYPIIYKNHFIKFKKTTFFTQ